MKLTHATPSVLPEHGLIAVLPHMYSLRPLLDSLISAGVSRERMAFMAREAVKPEIAPAPVDGACESTGMMAGGLTGMLAGLGTLAIPEFGVLLLSGGPWLVGALALAGASGGVGLGAIVGAIFEESVVHDHREIYQEHLESGHAILVVEGSGSEITLAAGALEQVPTLRVDIY